MVDLNNLQQPLHARKNYMFELFSEHVIAGASLLEWTTVENEEALLELMDHYVSIGNEGIIIKDPNSVYNFGSRNKSWIKMKPLETVDATIIDFEVGSAGTKNQDRLGAMIVETANGMKFKIGIGFSDQLRIDIWSNKEQYRGKWIEARYQKDTVADGRFGRFVRMRDDLNE